MGENDEGTLPQEAAELFAAPVEEFIKLRDKLAKELQKGGRSDQARLVKGLRKPTLAIWATNQGARREPKLVERLLGVSRTMQAAGSVAELRSASAERQTIIRSLVDAAIDALSEGGHASTGTVVDRVTRTLLAVSSDPDAQRALSGGVLERELEPELDFGFTSPPPDPEQGVDAGKVEEARHRVRALEDEVKALQHELADLDRSASDARERAVLAQIDAEKAGRKADHARVRLERKQGEVTDAQAVVAHLTGS